VGREKGGGRSVLVPVCPDAPPVSSDAPPATSGVEGS
jgi:hypothetical protein